MYTNFISQNSSSPYYHNSFQNQTGNEMMERDQFQQGTLGQSTSYGLNFSHYANNYSLSNMIKSEKLNNVGYNSNGIASYYNKGESVYQNINQDQMNPQQGQQRDEQNQDIHSDQSQNPSKSFKRIKSDQNIISAFARSTPQFYNLSKPQQNHLQQGQNLQPNEGFSITSAAAPIKVPNSINNINGSIPSDKEKINQISKIYSSHLLETKKAPKRSSVAQQDHQDKKSSPQIEKFNKGSQHAQGTHFIEQQFYNTTMSSFPTKTNNTLNSHRIDDNKQLYVFQQQTINFFGKKKKTPSIPSTLYQNSQGNQINLNIEQSQRGMVMDEKEVNENGDNVQFQSIPIKQQKSAIQIIKSDKRNSYNGNIYRNDSKSKVQQSINMFNNTLPLQMSSIQSHGQNQSKIMNIHKKQKSLSQKNVFMQNQTNFNTYNSANTPISGNMATSQQLQQHQQLSLSSVQQVTNTISNSSLMNKSERLSELPSSLISYKNSIQLKQQQQSIGNFAQNPNKNLFEKQKNSSLNKYQSSNSQSNKTNNKNTGILSNAQFNKSSSTIIHQTSQNLKSSEDTYDSEDIHPLTDHIKRSPSFYQQKINQQYQLQNNQQNQVQIRSNKPKRSQETSPSITNQKNQFEIIKRSSAISQIQNQINKQQGALNLSNNQRRQSSISKQQQNSEHENNYSHPKSEQIPISLNKQANLSEQVQSPQRKVLDRLQDKISTIQYDGLNSIESSQQEKKLTENQKIRNMKSQLSKHDQFHKLNYSTADNSQNPNQYFKESSSYINMSNINSQNTEDKPYESHRLILKKSSSQKINAENLQEQLNKKGSLNQPYSQFILSKQSSGEQQNQVFEVKKVRNMSQTMLSNNQQQIQKRESGNKTVEGILFEQKSYIIDRQKQHSRSPLKSFQTNQYPDGQYTDSTAVTFTHQIEEENRKHPLLESHLQKNQKMSSLHYQPQFKGDDYSPLGMATAYNSSQNHKEKKKQFSEKIQELREIKRSGNQDQFSSTGSFSIQLKNGQETKNNEEEVDLTPAKTKMPSQYKSSKFDEQSKQENEDPVQVVPQQIYEAISQISSNRPKTSEGGSRKRGSKLYSKIRFTNQANCFQNSEQNDGLQTENRNNNQNNRDYDENKLGQTLKKFYATATHHPSLVSKFESEGSSLSNLYKGKSDERNAYENISLPYDDNLNPKGKKKIDNEEHKIHIEKLLVDNENDLGIEEFQIEEINDDTVDNDDYSQAKKRQQELMKNNNFITDNNTNKILIRHNKSQNQKKRQLSSRQDVINYPEGNEEREDESINKPKGTHLKTDFLSLFAQ